MYLASDEYVTRSGGGARTVRMPRAQLSDADERFDALFGHTFKTILNNVTTVDAATSEDIDFGFAPDRDFELFVLGGSSFVGRGSIGSSQAMLSQRDRDLSRELNELGALFFEDYERALDPSSVSGLRLFLLAHSWTAVPSLSADSGGRVVATWRSDAESASLKFLDNNVFHYAMAVETGQTKSRPWGSTSRFEFFVERPEARAILRARPSASQASS
jgi:hypothetical protein